MRALWLISQYETHSCLCTTNRILRSTNNRFCMATYICSKSDLEIEPNLSWSFERLGCAWWFCILLALHSILKSLIYSMLNICSSMWRVRGISNRKMYSPKPSCFSYISCPSFFRIKTQAASPFQLSIHVILLPNRAFLLGLLET